MTIARDAKGRFVGGGGSKSPASITTRGASKVKRVFSEAEKRYDRIQRRKINVWLGRLRDAIRLGSWFDNPTPNLQQNVWAGQARSVGDTIEGSAGWGNRYGPVLEFGVTPKNQGGWWIEAKAAPLLRFQVGDRIISKKKVFHPWKHGSEGSRPHWSKLLDEQGMRGRIEKDLAATVKEVFSGR